MSAVRPVEHQNEFGFTLGGPIVRKRAFFFFSYDGWRYRLMSPTQLVSVPTLKMREGDFSELPVAIYDPASTAALPGGGFTRTQFRDPSRATAANPLGLNIIPLNRISNISKVYQSLLPAPTSPGRATSKATAPPATSHRQPAGARSHRMPPRYDLSAESAGAPLSTI